MKNGGNRLYLVEFQRETFVPAITLTKKKSINNGFAFKVFRTLWKDQSAKFRAIWGPFETNGPKSVLFCNILLRISFGDSEPGRNCSIVIREPDRKNNDLWNFASNWKIVRLAGSKIESFFFNLLTFKVSNWMRENYQIFSVITTNKCKKWWL